MPPSLCVVPGVLHNANTMEDFKDWDKAKMLEATARCVWDDIASGAALAEPDRLLRFLLLTFADLKSHKYVYWFAFPAFAMTPPPVAAPPVALSALLDPAQVVALRQGYSALGGQSGGARGPAFFAVRVVGAGGAIEVGARAQ